MYSNNRTRRKWNQVLLFLVSCHFVKYSISSPIFSSQFSQFQSARNLRNLPCIVKRSGLEGVCMFAIDCIKSNGTHLGTCIDKFYFGSCCQMKMQDVDSIYNPEISDNSIDSSSDSKPFIPVSSSTSISISTSVSHSRTTPMPTLNYNNKTFELIPTSKSPAGPSTEKYTASAGGFSTTLGTILEKNFTTTISLPTSTENSRISTFQTILSDEKSTRKPPSTTFNRTKKPPAKPTSQPSKKPVSQLQSLNRTSSVSSEAQSTTTPASTTTKKTFSSTVKLTKRPITTISSSSSTTVKPSKNATSTVIKTTRKPVASTNVTVNRRTTIPSRRNSTFTTTRRPTTTTQHSSSDTTATTSKIVTSKAPRPHPTPAEHIVKIDSSTLSAESMVLTTHSVQTTTEKSSTTVKPTISTIKSTVVTRKTTKRPQATSSSTTSSTTTTTTTASTTTTNKPVTESSILSSVPATVRDEMSSTLTSTTRKPDESTSTVSGAEFITWTLGNVVVNNSTNKGDAWVLVPSLTPSDVKPLTPPTTSTTSDDVELKITEMPPKLNLTQLFENITIMEEGLATEKVRETTMSAIAIEAEEEEENEQEEEEEEEEVITSSEENEESSSEDVKSPTVVDNGESEIATTEFIDIDMTSSSTTKPINVINLTLSTISTPSLQIGEFEEETTRTTVELSPDESQPAIDPDDTTMWSVTQRNNDTSSTTENYDSSSFSSSSNENDSSGMNETSTSRYPSSTAASLEGVDYKQICGRRMFPEARIVGGAKASFGRWPWQISLRQWRTSTYLHKCGSALLNENWAISAAHCVDNVPPSDLLLRLGEFDLSIEEEPYGYQERRVQIVASHPQFDPRTFEYDLALLRFYEPVVFQPNIIPVCVPENDEDFIGRTAFVTGWGRLYEDGPLPSTLQEVTVPVIRNDICEAMYRNAGYIEHIPHIFICAGHKLGAKDSCEGDSGGPMVIQREDKRFQLAGIISWGIGCAEPNQPGVYTRISEFRDWINQILMF